MFTPDELSQVVSYISDHYEDDKEFFTPGRFKSLEEAAKNQRDFVQVLKDGSKNASMHIVAEKKKWSPFTTYFLNLESHRDANSSFKKEIPKDDIQSILDRSNQKKHQEKQAAKATQDTSLKAQGWVAEGTKGTSPHANSNDGNNPHHSSHAAAAARWGRPEEAKNTPYAYASQLDPDKEKTRFLAPGEIEYDDTEEEKQTEAQTAAAIRYINANLNNDKFMKDALKIKPADLTKLQNAGGIAAIDNQCVTKFHGEDGESRYISLGSKQPGKDGYLVFVDVKLPLDDFLKLGQQQTAAGPAPTSSKPPKFYM